MRVIQLSKTRGADCGIALFADSLQAQLRAAGIEMVTQDHPPSRESHDLLLVQYHAELFGNDDVRSFAIDSQVPVVLFAHSECDAAQCEEVDGFISMCADMLPSLDKPAYTFPHPAWTPPILEDRAALRRQLDLPDARPIVGTNGFLKFERQFVEIVEALLPEVKRRDWFIELVTSPWRLDSPGLLSKLESLRERAPHHFRFHHGYLDAATLNRRLQACDLLWCWTAAPSSPYASGVISDQYASGTRIVAADKTQHRHILALPNTAAAPDVLEPFVDRIIDELRSVPRPRHDPSPVSWEPCVAGIAAFLRRFVTGG